MLCKLLFTIFFTTEEFAKLTHWHCELTFLLYMHAHTNIYYETNSHKISSLGLDALSDTESQETNKKPAPRGNSEGIASMV